LELAIACLLAERLRRALEQSFFDGLQIEKQTAASLQRWNPAGFSF
jgi:hypothetical protein